MEKYPYFINPALEALRQGDVSAEEAQRLRRLIAANVGDVPSLRMMLGIDPEEFAEFYPDHLPPSLSTADTIDSFLSRFGNPDAPTPMAAKEIPEPAENPIPPAKISLEEPPTVSLANKLIKNHDYQDALEIIQQLILIYPEKSVYFADQIRFLKKLIFNEARKPQIEKPSAQGGRNS